MPDLQVTDVRTFVPAKDFELSLEFYLALGWRKAWANTELALLEISTTRFYLQNYYVKDWAENCMLHVSVTDAHAWKGHAELLRQQPRFSDVRVREPREESYGALVTYVWDPSGVLLHFAQWDTNR